MAKVTFEFDECEDKQDVLEIVERHKLMSALYDLSDLYRKIYNGKVYGEGDVIYLKEDGCKATEEDYKKVSSEGHLLTGGESYIRTSYIENELDIILDKVRHLLDY